MIPYERNLPNWEGVTFKISISYGPAFKDNKFIQEYNEIIDDTFSEKYQPLGSILFHTGEFLYKDNLSKYSKNMWSIISRLKNTNYITYKDFIIKTDLVKFMPHTDIVKIKKLKYYKFKGEKHFIKAIGTFKGTNMHFVDNVRDVKIPDKMYDSVLVQKNVIPYLYDNRKFHLRLYMIPYVYTRPQNPTIYKLFLFKKILMFLSDKRYDENDEESAITHFSSQENILNLEDVLPEIYQTTIEQVNELGSYVLATMESENVLPYNDFYAGFTIWGADLMIERHKTNNVHKVKLLEINEKIGLDAFQGKEDIAKILFKGILKIVNDIPIVSSDEMIAVL